MTLAWTKLAQPFCDNTSCATVSLYHDQASPRELGECCRDGFEICGSPQTSSSNVVFPRESSRRPRSTLTTEFSESSALALRESEVGPNGNEEGAASPEEASVSSPVPGGRVEFPWSDGRSCPKRLQHCACHPNGYRWQNTNLQVGIATGISRRRVEELRVRCNLVQQV
jgi:hypothetical protein